MRSAAGRELGVDGRIAVMLRWADAISRDAELIAAAEGTDTARIRVAREVPAHGRGRGAGLVREGHPASSRRPPSRAGRA